MARLSAAPGLLPSASRSKRAKVTFCPQQEDTMFSYIMLGTIYHAPSSSMTR